MENLLSFFHESLKRLNVSKKDRLLLAVSGGLDSVVLTACCAMSGLDFEIAHANFQLRGAESQRDEDFVRELAVKYEKNFLTIKFETENYAEINKCSIQVAARNLRYDWFKILIGKEPKHFQFLLTAHHLDDNIETMIMHFFRGTGISGLSGMPEKNEWLIRPLLTIPKSRLMAFAVYQNLTWMEDSSNFSDDYTRNYFRNQLIPSLTKVFPEVLRNMEKNLHRFSDAHVLYEQAVSHHKKKLLNRRGAEDHIPILLLKKVIPLHTILYEIIKDYNFSPAQTEEIVRLMESANGKYISSPSHRIIRNRRWLIIAPVADPSVSHIIIDHNETSVIYPNGKLRIKEEVIKKSENSVKDPAAAFLDAGKIIFPLILRKWKTGDYFYPLGMKKKKKLARFFIDQKLSKTAKEKVWVMEMDSQIIWVVGQRIDDRFCIRESTNRILIFRNEEVPGEI